MFLCVRVCQWGLVGFSLREGLCEFVSHNSDDDSLFNRTNEEQSEYTTLHFFFCIKSHTFIEQLILLQLDCMKINIHELSLYKFLLLLLKVLQCSSMVTSGQKCVVESVVIAC